MQRNPRYLQDQVKKYFNVSVCDQTPPAEGRWIDLTADALLCEDASAQI